MQQLDCLHKFPVKEGETFLIRGGIPHAIGAGCFLVEIQEPTDYSIRTERTTPAGLKVSDFMCHQGLGFDKMFDCFTYEGLDETSTRKTGCIEAKCIYSDTSTEVTELIGYESTPCFRMNKIEIKGDCQFNESDTFYGLYMLGGKGELISEKEKHTLEPGMQFFIPANCKKFSIVNTDTTPITCIQAFGPEAK